MVAAIKNLYRQPKTPAAQIHFWINSRQHELKRDS